MDTSRAPSLNTGEDEILRLLADYVCDPIVFGEETMRTAQLCLLDALSCAILALQYSACTKLLGPIIPSIVCENGTRVPGTDFVLDPVTAAFNIGTMIRWLDYNDTWLAREWGHPSDNLGGILAVGDYLDRNETVMHMRDILVALVKVYEIQGVLALENSFNEIGFDHVIFVKVATAALATKMLGGTREQVVTALSQAWIDTGPLRTYRHAPNTGSRKSWAAGDATARGVQLALWTLRGEGGYPQALGAKKWGVYDAWLRGKELVLARPLGSYVVDHILFKVSFPAEFHAQTAVEAAIALYPQVKERWEEIEKIVIHTHTAAKRIIDKQGPLNNPADRDHCMQYMVAVALLFGELRAEDYEAGRAQDPRIDRLREKISLIETPDYSRDYLDPDKRAIPNALTVYFSGGEVLGPKEVLYPLGHVKRRQEALPLLRSKCAENLRTHFSAEKVAEIFSLVEGSSFPEIRVSEFLALF